MSQANRLKLIKSRELQSKKKYKHGEIQKSGSKKRGYKVRYWNQKTGSWQSTKPSPIVKKIKKVEKKPLTRAEKLKKDGMATWNTKKGQEAWGAELPDSKMVRKDTGGNKDEVKDKEQKVVKQVQKTDENKENKDNKVVEKKKEVKGKETLKIKKLIKKKKGKGFVSTKSPRGKQLLKIEERKRKLREKRFGKK